MNTEAKTVRVSIGMLIVVILLLVCVGAIGGYIGAHTNKSTRIEVSPSSNTGSTMIPISQQITVSPGKLASDTIASKSKSVFLLAHQTANGFKGFATGIAVTNDGIIASTQNGGNDPIFALGDDATSIEASSIGTDTLTGLHFFKLTNRLISPIDVVQTAPKIGSTLLMLSRSATTIAPEAQTTILSLITPASTDAPEGIQQVGVIQQLANSTAGSALLDEDGKLEGLLRDNNGSGVILASDIAQAITRLSSNTLTQNPFADIGFSITWSLQQDNQSRISVKAVVQAITPKGIAAQAGLKTGDIITAVNASTVTWDSNFTTLLSNNQLQLNVLRNGTPTSITLAKQAS